MSRRPVGPRALFALVAPLLLLLGSAGCKPAAPGWPRLAPKPTPPARWTEQTIKNGWITVNVGLPHHGRAPYPVVLSPIVPDHELLSRGIGVVRWKTNWSIVAAVDAFQKPKPTPAVPAVPTPEPVGVWMLRSERPGIIGRGYFRVITTEAHKTVPVVLDHIRRMPDIDESRIAITGSSTGGFTALQAMAENPSIAAGVIQVACGGYSIFLKSSSLALDDQERYLAGGEIVLDDDYAAELAAIDPLSRASNFPPRPVLLVSGAQDRAIPAACVEATAARFSDVYEQAGLADRFQWVEFEERGHNMGPEAELLILDFLDEWLLKPRAGHTSP